VFHVIRAKTGIPGEHAPGREKPVIASEAKQSIVVRSAANRKGRLRLHGLPRRFAPRNDGSL
jgi:hypothetical protein